MWVLEELLEVGVNASKYIYLKLVCFIHINISSMSCIISFSKENKTFFSFPSHITGSQVTCNLLCLAFDFCSTFKMLSFA